MKPLFSSRGDDPKNTQLMAQQLLTMLGGGLTLRDNQNAAIVAYSLTHGVELGVANPLKSRPLGFDPKLCVDANGVAQPLPTITFNPFRTDGLIGLTATYDLKHTAPAVELLRTSDVNLVANTWTALACDSVVHQRTAVLSVNGGAVTVGEDGSYFVSAMAPQKPAANNSFGVCVAVGANVSNLAQGRVLYGFNAIAHNEYIEIAGSGVVTCTAGTVLTPYAYAGPNAGVLDSTNFPRFEVHRLFNDSIPVRTVTGVLWGG